MSDAGFKMSLSRRKRFTSPTLNHTRLEVERVWRLDLKTALLHLAVVETDFYKAGMDFPNIVGCFGDDILPDACGSRWAF